MRTLEMIDTEIAELHKQLEEVKGTETEVYTRIVGYYRSLRNWNKGKREEYNHRLPFGAEVSVGPGTERIPEPAREESPQGMLFSEVPAEKISAFSYFYRKTCPNCPPVEDFVSRLPIEGTFLDVDTDEGFSQAMNYQVLSTPTVVFFDNEGRPLHHYHSVSQMKELLPVLSAE